MEKYLLLLFLMFSTLAFPKAKVEVEGESEIAPSFHNIGAEDQTSTLSMTCEGTPPYKSITCSFIQLSVRKKQYTDEERKKQIADIDGDKTTIKDIKKDFCDKNRNLEFDSKLRADLVPERVIAAKDAYNSFSGICDCLDTSCAKKILKTLITQEPKTCSVFAWDFKAKFKRISKYKWISNEGPKGLCEVSNVSTIEKDKDSGLWTYSDVRVDADTSSELCKGLEINRPRRYSWKNGSEFHMDCPIIKMGLF